MTNNSFGLQFDYDNYSFKRNFVRENVTSIVF